ncbi:inner membrane protein CreD [Klebsiella pneumoniae]|uniref:Inner membrane protein CreD n=1 Tax=Klebsiella pneumoniae TaxID=573 RepID=A0A377WCQ5_KLEPN|nr:inner membrane protein CreD [Klebsiella pneumoniae]
MSLADQYQLTDRATKYAILLIGLTFMAFFVFESLTRRPLHPMQYLLVGLSLVLFLPGAAGALRAHWFLPPPGWRPACLAR